MKKLAAWMMDAALYSAGACAKAAFALGGWPLLWRSGRWLGDRAWRRDAFKRETTRTELARTFGTRFPPEQIDAIARRGLQLYYSRLIEMYVFGAMSAARIDRGMVAEGLEHVEAASARGKGVIILLSHFGSFLLPLPFLGHRGYKVNQIAGPEICPSIASRRIWLWRRSEAARLPVQFVQIGKFLRPVYKALARNEVVVIAFDGRESASWVTVPFFNRKADFSAGPFELARRTGATIIPTFVVRDDTRGVHRLVLEPPFELPDQTDTAAAVADDTRRFAALWCRYAEQYPCHFAMMIHRFRQQELAIGDRPFFVDEPRPSQAEKP